MGIFAPAPLNAVAVCWERGLTAEALLVATALRRAKVTTDFALSGKPQRQFEKAKAAGYQNILTVKAGSMCRVWFSWSEEGFDGSVKDALALLS